MSLQRKRKAEATMQFSRLLASNEVWEYGYDTQNRLVEVKKNDVTIAKYRYDPFGRRLWKEVTADGGTPVRTFYHYNLEGLDGEYVYDGTDPVELRTYGYLPGSAWTTDPLFLKEGGEYFWYLNDHLGTPKKLVDDSGEVVWSATHDAFGKATVSGIENNLRFPGQYHDEETGLHYNFHRYYDPETGRYLSVDPLRDGVNWYEYAGGNPVQFVDPEGKILLECAIVGATIFGATFIADASIDVVQYIFGDVLPNEDIDKAQEQSDATNQLISEGAIGVGVVAEAGIAAVRDPVLAAEIVSGSVDGTAEANTGAFISNVLKPLVDPAREHIEDIVDRIRGQD